MFREPGEWPTPDRWRPPTPRRRLSRKDEKRLVVLIGAFLFALLLAPLGGSTLVAAMLAIAER